MEAPPLPAGALVLVDGVLVPGVVVLVPPPPQAVNRRLQLRAAAPYGLDGGNEFCLYLPGTPAENISPRCRSWSGGYYGLFEAGAVLSGYGLCDLRLGYGFFSFS